MTYILRIGPWHVGPFYTHTGAHHWADRHGCDDYTMIPLDDPAEVAAMVRNLPAGSTVLFKASRVVGLDHVVRLILG